MNLNLGPLSFYHLFFGSFPAHLLSFQTTVVSSSPFFIFGSSPPPSLPVSHFLSHLSLPMLVRCVHRFGVAVPSRILSQHRHLQILTFVTLTHYVRIL